MGWDIQEGRIRGDARFAQTFSINSDLLHAGMPLFEAKRSKNDIRPLARDTYLPVAATPGQPYAAAPLHTVPPP